MFFGLLTIPKYFAYFYKNTDAHSPCTGVNENRDEWVLCPPWGRGPRVFDFQWPFILVYLVNRKWTFSDSKQLWERPHGPHQCPFWSSMIWACSPGVVFRSGKKFRHITENEDGNNFLNQPRMFHEMGGKNFILHYIPLIQDVREFFFQKEKLYSEAFNVGSFSN